MIDYKRIVITPYFICFSHILPYVRLIFLIKDICVNTQKKTAAEIFILPQSFLL